MWWEKAGKHNTYNTLSLALEKARQLGIKDIIIASCSGDSALKLLSNCSTSEFNIICVTHHTGFAKPGENEMSDSMRRDLLNQGVNVLTTTHVLAGVDRAIRNQFGGVYPAEIMAQTLRIFGQGVKVAVEISVMALDSGLIPYGKPVIAIGGSAVGSDAAIVIKPAHARDFFATEVEEIICMPRKKKPE